MKKKHLDILIENEIKSPELTEEQLQFLHGCIRGSYEYKDGVVNVDGGVDFSSENLTSIPVQFGIVTGNFWSNNNKLISLKGFPYEVNSFDCSQNQLTTLEYAPTKINAYAYIMINPFILNNKLFEDLRKLGWKNKIDHFKDLMHILKQQIPIQFGVTDEDVIEEIWQSYINIKLRKQK